MKIKMLKSSICDGRRVAVDEVVDASDKAGKFLLLSRKAVLFESVEEVVEVTIDGGDEPKKRGRERSPVNRMVEEDEIDNRDAGE